MLTSLFPKTHTRYTSLPIVGDVLEDLCLWLQAQGFPPNAIGRRIEAAPLLAECLRRGRVQSLFGRTANELRACFPRQKQWTPQVACALGRSLLKYLEERGVLTSEAPSLSDQLIRTYCEHLERVRGLAASTIVNHEAYASSFLRFIHYDENAQRLAQLRIGDLETFVTEASTRVGRITMQKVVAVMRSFMRFLASSGAAPVGLDRQIESPRRNRGERLVRALPWSDILTLLKAIDRSTEKGCRDYAMLLLIAAYGLRRAEVASLGLDDIQWRAKVIRVPRPKIGAPLAVPLTDEVATALLAYLRHRPKEPNTRQVFLRVRAPGGPIEPTAVTDVFDFWAERAGLQVPGLGGPHCLRHGLAMHLLRRNTPLKTIGDLLGHRSVESTGVYLRLQIADLRDVALSVPTADSCRKVQP